MGIVALLVLALVFIVYASLLVLRLEKEACALRQKMEAWKDYAIAVETTYECRSEIRHAPSYRKAIAQFRAAKEGAVLALWQLEELGEYPEAQECSPFGGYVFEDQNEEDEDEEEEAGFPASGQSR